jgi:hypothetical protein
MNESAPSLRIARRRPVRLLDLLALVAAVALALGMPAVVKAATPAEARTKWARHQYVEFCAVSTLYGWTAVLLGLRLADRPAPRRSRRDAGVAALVAVAATFALLAVKQIATVLVVLASQGWEPVAEHAWFHFLLYYSNDACGAAVVAVWLSLALGGALRRPSDWLSWAAALLGGLWILLTLVGPLIYYLPISWLQVSGIS